MGLPIIQGSNTTKIQALTDILESIALEQASVAHILNAEGEKLQRIIADETNTTQDLLAADKSVDNLADTLTNLVMLLKSKMRLVLNDKCYANFCDDPCAGYEFIFNAENGTITPLLGSQDEYNLVVDDGATEATVIVTTNPAVAVTITNVVGTNVIANATGNEITITPDPDFDGTVTATLTLPNGCTRNITIYVSQEVVIECDDYVLDLTETNGTLTLNPNGTYSFVVANPQAVSTILVETIPDSTVVLTDVFEVDDVDASVNDFNELVITSPGATYTGTISAMVNFGDGCMRQIIIYVSTTASPCDTISLIPTLAGDSTLTQLGGPNHYQWELTRIGTGDTITITTNPATAVTSIIEQQNTVSGGTVAYGANTITITKASDAVAAGLLVVSVNYGTDCTSIMRFNVDTPED